MRILPKLAAAALLLCAAPAMATNGHQLIGVGGYQNSMGGATTAAPYDTTTAVSNPAGLAMIEQKADFNFEAFMPKRSADFTGAGGQANEGGSPLYLVPAVGWTGEVTEDTYFGGGMFLISGMGVDYDTIDSVPFGAQQGDMTPWKANLYSQYQFWKLAPTLAHKYGDNLAVGVSLNIDYQQMAFKQIYFNPNNPAQYMGADLSRAGGAMGYGATIGGLYKVNEMFTVGATYITQQTFADMEYRLSQGDVMMPANAQMSQWLMSGNGTYKMGMHFPQQVAIGVAVVPMAGLKLTADYKWINFKSTHNSIDLKGNYAVVDPSTGQAVGSASAMPMNFGWDDVNVIAVGVEYAVNPLLTMRAGYNHGNSPIKEEDVFNNMIFPAIVTDHMSVGADFRMGHNWEAGLAYMKAFKKEIKGSGDMMGQTSGALISLEENSFIVSIAYNYGK
ncbi:MAG: outer membrane protein transport protein [Nitrospinae bacterium]|nr:outer membrane protein transport protein [Nitrospinota bacterium]